eukprot:1804075-Pleurochrysis_carterae.AAC.3
MHARAISKTRKCESSQDVCTGCGPTQSASTLAARGNLACTVSRIGVRPAASSPFCGTRRSRSSQPASRASTHEP